MIGEAPVELRINPTETRPAGRRGDCGRTREGLTDESGREWPDGVRIHADAVSLPRAPHRGPGETPSWAGHCAARIGGERRGGGACILFSVLPSCPSIYAAGHDRLRAP